MYLDQYRMCCIVLGGVLDVDPAAAAADEAFLPSANLVYVRYM